MALSKPLKLRMYEGVTTLNQNFEQVLQNLKGLRKLQIFPRRFLRLCEGRLEQLRAEANCELVRVLQACETADSARFNNMTAQSSRRRKGAAKRLKAAC